MTAALSRRDILLGLTATMAAGRARLALAAAPTDARFVVVILRGAMDGMGAVAPYGDPAFAEWRGALAPLPPGADGGLLDMGGFFGLHPVLAGMYNLYQAGELLPVHAIAGPYRTRSHFDAQDLMEYGAAKRTQGMTSGWLNRAAGTLSSTGRTETAFALGAVPPILLRGPTRVGSWIPQVGQQPSADLYARIAALHEHDPITGPALRMGLDQVGLSTSALAGLEPPKNRFAFPALAEAAGRLLGTADGPRLAAMELSGWDTHVGQGVRLKGALAELDQGLVALKAGLGEAWQQTVVLVMTEFGRTARINGTNGTDHGTATAAFVLGGRVAGGRVQADWPGLARGKLFEDRDLQPTADLRSVAKGLLADHLRLDGTALDSVFPGSQSAAPMTGLLRA